ncbi:MAG: cytochrome c oxidase subunit 3 family protein [Campylobacterota bacterium]
MTQELQVKQELPPGDFAIWIIIYVEFVTFAALFVGYAFARRENVEMFNQSQLLLDQRAGFINTLILITSSWFVVKAVQAIKDVDHKKASAVSSRWLLAAMGMGSVFMLVKIMEFADRSAEGINLSTNTFFMFYIMLTAFHFLHVLLGLIILFAVYQKARAGGYTSQDHRGMETGASYWHLVDLLWIVLFPLVYIIR